MNHRTEVKRNDILDTAALLFAERGFQGTNMKLLAKTAQASTSTIYSYFQDKNDLLTQSVERRLEQLESDHANRLSSMDDPVEALLQGLSLLNNSVAGDPLLSSLLTYERATADIRLTQHARRVMARIDQHSIELVERGVRDHILECDDPRSLVLALRFSFQGWLMNRERGDTDLSQEAFTRTVKHLILGMMNDE